MFACVIRDKSQQVKRFFGFDSDIFPLVAGSILIPFGPVYYVGYNVVDGDDMQRIYKEQATRTTITLHNKFFVILLPRV